MVSRERAERREVIRVETLGGVPWFGFRFFDDCTMGAWWCHSFVVDGNLWIDSAPPSATSLYFAMPYDEELFRMLWPNEKDVPAILTMKEPPSLEVSMSC